MKDILITICRLIGIICFIVSLVLSLKWAFKYWNVILFFLDFKNAVIGMVKPFLLMIAACTICYITENVLDKE